MKQILNNKGNNFLRTKTLWEGKIVYFAFFFIQNFFLKKFEVVLIASFTIIYYTTEKKYLGLPIMENLSN